MGVNTTGRSESGVSARLYVDDSPTGSDLEVLAAVYAAGWVDGDGDPCLSTDEAESWGEDAGEGETLHRWTLPDGRWIYMFSRDEAPWLDTDNAAEVVRRHAEDEGLLGGTYRVSEWMASWGFDGLDYETEVEDGDGYEGDCMIWSQPNCYESRLEIGRVLRVRDVVTVEDAEGDLIPVHDDRHWVGTRAEAEAYIASAGEGVYCTTGREYAPPCHTIIRVDG